MAERPFKPAALKLFWGEDLSRFKKEGGSLWRASKRSDDCYESLWISMDRVAETDR